jgi:hypothetical protein
VEVRGPIKDHVGETYACLAEVLLCFASLGDSPTTVYAQYPVFNRQNGNIMFVEARKLTKYWD